MDHADAERLNDGWNDLVRRTVDGTEADATVLRLHAMAEAISPPAGLAERVDHGQPALSFPPGLRGWQGVSRPSRLAPGWFAAMVLVMLVLGLALAPLASRQERAEPAAAPRLAFATPPASAECDVVPRTREEVLAIAKSPPSDPAPTVISMPNAGMVWKPKIPDDERRAAAETVRRWYACGHPEHLLNRWALATDEYVRGVIADTVDREDVSAAIALDQLANALAIDPRGLHCTGPDSLALRTDGRIMQLVSVAGDALPPTRMVLEGSASGWRVARTASESGIVPEQTNIAPAVGVVQIEGSCALALFPDLAPAPAPASAPAADSSMIRVVAQGEINVSIVGDGVTYLSGSLGVGTVTEWFTAANFEVSTSDGALTLFEDARTGQQFYMGYGLNETYYLGG